MISLEKLQILTPLKTLPNNVGDLGKLIVANGFEKLPKVQYITQSGHTGGNESIASFLLIFCGPNRCGRRERSGTNICSNVATSVVTEKYSFNRKLFQRDKMGQLHNGSKLKVSYKIIFWAVVVAQLAARLLSTPQIRGSNPAIVKILHKTCELF